jgi:hypothetical protein
MPLVVTTEATITTRSKRPISETDPAACRVFLRARRTVEKWPEPG